jgi:hypothetical protein
MADADIVPANLDSIAAIVAYVNANMATRVAASYSKIDVEPLMVGAGARRGGQEGV